MYSGLSDFIKAIPHPSGWGTFPLEPWDEGWEEMRLLLTVLSCMRFHSSICVHHTERGGSVKQICMHPLCQLHS